MSEPPTQPACLDLTAADRPYPKDAAERFSKAWASVPMQYTPPPSRRGYLDWFQAAALPAAVCKGVTPEGRRFVAFCLREEIHLGDLVVPAEEAVPTGVGVAHERYTDAPEPWVWAGTTYGSLLGYADPELVEALLAGRAVQLQDGFRLVPVTAPAAAPIPRAPTEADDV